MKAVQSATIKIISSAVALVFIGWLAYWEISSVLQLKQDKQVGDELILLTEALSTTPPDQWHVIINKLIPEKACKVFLTPKGEPEGVITEESLSYWQQQLPVSLHGYLQTIDNWVCTQIEYDSWYLYDLIPGVNWNVGLVVKTTAEWPYIAVLLLIEFVIFIAAVNWFLFPIKRRAMNIERLLMPLIEQDVKPEKIIAKLIDELKTLRQDAELNQEEWRDLLHGVAHELRSPVARISFALSEWSHVTAEEERNELEASINRAMDDLDKLVHEVLRYSRLELSAKTLNIQACDLVDLLDDCCLRIQPIYPEVQMHLEGERPFMINVDEQQLERAVINVLRNAARYAKQHIHVQWHKSDSGWALIIDDDGTGVPPGKRQRIFEPFTRLDPSRSRDSGGSGLGLAIVKTIVDNHAGSIEVGDSPLGGARFSLNFPQLVVNNTVL